MKVTVVVELSDLNMEEVRSCRLVKGGRRGCFFLLNEVLLNMDSGFSVL